MGYSNPFTQSAWFLCIKNAKDVIMWVIKQKSPYKKYIYIYIYIYIYA